MKGTKGLLAKVIGDLKGVYGVVVEERQKLIRPPFPTVSFSEFEQMTEEERQAVWGETIDTVPYIEVDVDLQSPFEKAHVLPRHKWGAWKLDHLEVIYQVGEVLEEMRAAGITWTIKQKEELMGKDGELPTFSELAKKIPDIKNTVMDLMGYLDLWTLRSLQVKTDKEGKFESAWVPGLAPEAAKPKGLENWTVLLLEFCVPSHTAERFTTLVRSVNNMTSKLGEAGSFTNTLEDTVRKTLVENEELRWAAAAYKEIAERAVELAYDSLVASRANVVVKVQSQNIEDELVALRAMLDKEDNANVGAVFLKRFEAMERAVNERRPELAAELIRGLDDE